MINTEVLKSCEVLNDWDNTLDNVMNERPVLVQHENNTIVLASTNFYEQLLCDFKFHINTYIELDGGYSAKLEELPIEANAKEENESINLLLKRLIDYATDFYNNYKNSTATEEEKIQIPYILKAILLSNVDNIKRDSVINKIYN